MSYFLGRQKARIDEQTLRMAVYSAALAAPPVSRRWDKAVVTPWGMMANDQYGDCTVAAMGHMIMDWSANVGKEIVISDSDILSFYKVVSGGQDQGANMLDVLNRWRKVGLNGHRIEAYMALKPTSRLEAKQAVNLFGAAYLGISLPDFTVADGKDWLTIPWVKRAKCPPDPNNGHCVPLVAYDSKYAYCVTWGALHRMSWAFYEAYVEEAYAVLSPDWIGANGKAPVGFDLAALRSDLAAI